MGYEVAGVVKARIDKYFYFKVREVVYSGLERGLTCSAPEFSSLFRQLTESLWKELTESHLSSVGSLQGLVMTGDIAQYIRNMVDRKRQEEAEVRQNNQM